MKPFQFTCAVRIDRPGDPHHGHLLEIAGLKTPVVQANTITEAYNKPETSEFCALNKCTIHKVVMK